MGNQESGLIKSDSQIKSDQIPSEETKESKFLEILESIPDTFPLSYKKSATDEEV